ncbi:hypothetical protein SAMN02910298_00260 [Pseudobutyrivibrio sp. YE44]|uniref:hypothetical protein n=1 Tax=Pseudobutyrivibrio sp. YE44 TaxID=1520802 RepID=UPI000888A90E|nr:hypothetical protein [Pseudobutyrivibrio sp. YE44]SDB07661.1 hypothetical protein SAMN02910298_00260 [Pseudobutyrivibrio sp. YE44]
MGKLKEQFFVIFPGRPVNTTEEMVFDFDGDDYLDPAEEEELMHSLDDDQDEADFDDEFDEDF